MTHITDKIAPGGRRRWVWPSAIAVAALALAFPGRAGETASFIGHGMIAVAPQVLPGIVVSAWVTASGAGDRIARAFDGRLAATVVAASAVGAVTPVCGVAVLPLMAGLLASGIPFAPVMAFWLSSPVTDPAMLATTAATLGWPFAVAKSLAAFGLGIFGGTVTAAMTAPKWTGTPLRDSRLVAKLGQASCGGARSFQPWFWPDRDRRDRFLGESWSMARLITLCLVPAFAAEHLLNDLLQPRALAAYVGEDGWWAVPLAVFVGAPAYLDGYAALPLTRALMDHGMSAGAAMAFLVSGSVVSIWGAMAIAPVLRPRPFLLYLMLAVVGSLGAGWLYGLVA